jgi:hypothetical protein
MLIINNIQKLIGTYIGKWEVTGADIDYESGSKSPDHNYTIRLGRNSMGAAIIIERTEGEFGYNVSICYESYDNVISITPWPKDRLIDKANFMASMRGVIDAEYDKNK